MPALSHRFMVPRMTKKRRVIIDCDPGVDDAVMLVLAFGSPELDILGVTTVGGNVPGEMTSRNARILREICGREDVPVCAGCDRPMVRPIIGASDFHGESGLGGMKIFEPKAPLDSRHGVAFIIEALSASKPKSVTLIITGPMTNLAMALVSAPGIAAAIESIVIMGGARAEGGNITASAEYNIYADPHAAHIVLQSGVKQVWFGLDVSHQLRATQKRIDAIRALGTRSAGAAADVMQFSLDTEKRIVGWDAPPLHDPCPAAYLLDPKLFDVVPAQIKVETASELTLGHTQVEFRESYGPFNALWATSVRDQGVFDLIGAAAKRLP